MPRGPYFKKVYSEKFFGQNPPMRKTEFGFSLPQAYSKCPKEIDRLRERSKIIVLMNQFKLSLLSSKSSIEGKIEMLISLKDKTLDSERQQRALNFHLEDTAKKISVLDDFIKEIEEETSRLKAAILKAVYPSEVFFDELSNWP